MMRLGPYEAQPFLAVAVSGGADSMALCLLADRWARAHGGRVAALTVDHGLRAAAADEARRVASWMAARGIEHHTLVWRPPNRPPNLQASAREARHRLLEEWCRNAGCLHLLLAHHREDQAETLLTRLARGSGLDGLAAMAPLRESAATRLLRPLLAVERRRLAANLAEAGQAWVEDPSNADAAYTRVRLRRSAAVLAREGLGPERLAATARRLGRARAALEGEVARTLARAVALHPAGFARLDAAALAAAPHEIALRSLARLVATIGGTDYGPRLERLERLHAALAAGLAAARTLGGCRLVPWRGAVLVCREEGAMMPPGALPPGMDVRWDGRFSLRLAASAPRGLAVGGIADGAAGDERLGARLAALPGAVRRTLPAIFDLVGIVAVPHLQYGAARGGDILASVQQFAFRPDRPLAGPGFTVV
jgi:tRNA(Ile)-lysidine synthase